MKHQIEVGCNQGRRNPQRRAVSAAVVGPRIWLWVFVLYAVVVVSAVLQVTP